MAGASRVAQMVKHLPAMQETWVQSLGQEEPLEKEWQPTPVFWPGKSHGQKSLVGYSPWGPIEMDTTEQLTHTHTHTHNRSTPDIFQIINLLCVQPQNLYSSIFILEKLHSWVSIRKELKNFRIGRIIRNIRGTCDILTYQNDLSV